MQLRKFYCVDHGYLCDAFTTATVICGERTGGARSRRCNKRGVDRATYVKHTSNKEVNGRRTHADH